MTNNNHVFHNINPCLDSFRLLYDFEIPGIIEKLRRDNIRIYSIPLNDWRCQSLKAKVNDIICIKNHIAMIYRVVHS